MIARAVDRYGGRARWERTLPGGAGGASFVRTMIKLLGGTSIAGALLLLALLPACKRPPDERARSSDNTVRNDVKDVARTTGKAAKDVGRAASGAADRAGQEISEAGKKVGAGSQDAWITASVKSELTSKGFDPLRVHVDTDGKVVTLSGTVASAAERAKAVALARAVKDVASVTDHLFIGPPPR
jgi:hyperosmotically inducible protein